MKNEEIFISERAIKSAIEDKIEELKELYDNVSMGFVAELLSDVSFLPAFSKRGNPGFNVFFNDLDCNAFVSLKRIVETHNLEQLAEDYCDDEKQNEFINDFSDFANKWRTAK